MVVTDRQLFETNKKKYLFLKMLFTRKNNSGYSIQYAGLLVSVWVMSNTNDSWNWRWKQYNFTIWKIHILVHFPQYSAAKTDSHIKLEGTIKIFSLNLPGECSGGISGRECWRVALWVETFRIICSRRKKQKREECSSLAESYQCFLISVFRWYFTWFQPWRVDLVKKYKIALDGQNYLQNSVWIVKVTFSPQQGALVIVQ